ncbi:MAG: hypothetical protein A2902_00585 [Elusimicrobia bacterium RIFCSPLOWO2_01_FULL_64_13]|nr:MAG: hypothetical protein A2902_00585 [Elusimicrobia bacterium RIFCSPLOWO2_01_FULL_64_13]
METAPGPFRSRGFLAGFLFTVLYAASDEWHQTFVFGRSGSSADVFVDCVGSLAGAFLHLRIKNAQKKEAQTD